MKIRLLGSGTSSGVPRIGNDWGACDPAEPRNRRTRQSAIIETARTRILIDSGPDMRAQLLAANIDQIDAVIWTHDHADHCHGIDDLRQLYHARGQAIQGYARPATLDALKKRFSYVFEGRGGYPPMARIAPLPDRIEIGDIGIEAFDQPHGNIESAGLVFSHQGRRIGYATDFHELTSAMRAAYSALDIWAVDALRRKPHPSHPHLAQVLEWVGELRPRHAVLIHLDQSMDYQTLVAELPAGIEPGYDGLELAA